MVVAASKKMADGLFTPYRGLDQNVVPIGTFNTSVVVVGDGSGGTAIVDFTMDAEEFGFRASFIPTLITIADTLATPEQVELSYATAGNSRLEAALVFTVLPIASGTGNTINLAGSQLAVPIEPNTQQTNQVILSFRWSSNVTAKAYQAILFGLMYDMERMAKLVGGRPDAVFFGVR